MSETTAPRAETRTGLDEFRAAREFLLAHREDYDTAYRDFRWPELDEFNWALEWFDHLGAAPDSADRAALRIVEQDGTDTSWTFAQLSARSNQVANWLRAQGVARGDRIVLMLGNQVELWESVLAAMKLGAVVIPATTLLAEADLADRIERGNARHVIVAAAETGKWAEVPGDYTRIAVGSPVHGWSSYSYAYDESPVFTPDGVTRASDTLLLYFTSGTTAKPKLVEHTQVSYPVGHLSTMYWVGLEPGDVHLNISSPGWAKHAWSNIYAPWNAGATVMIYNYSRFDAATMLEVMGRCGDARSSDPAERNSTRSPRRCSTSSDPTWPPSWTVPCATCAATSTRSVPSSPHRDEVTGPSNTKEWQ